MAKHVDIARALKDRSYFNSLGEEEKAIVRNASPIGESRLDDQDLDSVSGGLAGGESLQSTTTSSSVEDCWCKPTQGESVAATDPPLCMCDC
jgi:hypothetical protein